MENVATGWFSMSKGQCGLLLVYVHMGVFGNYDDHSSLNGNDCNYPTFLDMVPGFDRHKWNFVPLV